MPEKPTNTHKILEEARTVREETERAHKEGLFAEAEKRIFRPFFDIDYSVEQQDIENGGNRINFHQISLDAVTKKQLYQYIRHFEQRAEFQRGAYSEENNWHALDQLSYTIGETDFDIFGYIPEGYKILFCPNSEITTGSVDREKKTIYIAGDIASIGSLAIMLHEIGHIKDDGRLKKLGRTEFTEGSEQPIENFRAEQLRKEREASLFALRRMWRELRKNEQAKQDVLLYLKNMAYYSYCENALISIASYYAQGHIARGIYDTELDLKEEVERENWDAWWKFKHSDEYQAWKILEEFAPLDEDEEYGAWLNWIEETGKVNNADFMEKFFGYKSE